MAGLGLARFRWPFVAHGGTACVRNGLRQAILLLTLGLSVTMFSFPPHATTLVTRGGERLGLDARTPRRWQDERRLGLPMALLGRPLLRSPRHARQAVLALLDELGPGVGVPTQRACFCVWAFGHGCESRLTRFRRRVAPGTAGAPLAVRVSGL
jgi:hypothetical protein